MQFLGIFAILKLVSGQCDLNHEQLASFTTLDRFPEHVTVASMWSLQIKINIPLFVVFEVFANQSIDKIFKMARQI